MSDLLPALAERLQAVVDDATYSDNYKIVVGERLAYEALAFVAARLPTREEVARILGNSQMLRENEWQQADALLRDLRGRLGVQ